MNARAAAVAATVSTAACSAQAQGPTAETALIATGVTTLVAIAFAVGFLSGRAYYRSRRYF